MHLEQCWWTSKQVHGILSYASTYILFDIHFILYFFMFLFIYFYFILFFLSIFYILFHFIPFFLFMFCLFVLLIMPQKFQPFLPSCIDSSFIFICLCVSGSLVFQQQFYQQSKVPQKCMGNWYDEDDVVNEKYCFWIIQDLIIWYYCS